MDDLRKEIEGIDKQLIELLGKRMKLSEKIGNSKKEFGLPIQDKEREKEVKKELKSIAKENNLSEAFVDGLYDHIFDESRRIQMSDS